MMRQLACAVLVLLYSVALYAGQPAATVFEIKPDKELGTYAAGETVKWTVVIKHEGKPATGKATYTLKTGGLTAGQPTTVDLSAEGGFEASGTRADAGTLTLEVKYKPVGLDKEAAALGGAVFDYEKIKASMPPPDDFDAFWAAKIAELQAVPMNAVVTKVENKTPNVEYSKVTLDNIRGAKIYGHIAKPAGKTGLPALVQVQYAGVYGLKPENVTGSAQGGWLAFNITAHDIPIDESDEFYKKQSEGPLKDYRSIGNDDREKSYFLRMFLSCYRAVDYITQHPDWDKKTLIVVGGSQGGYQAIVTAGMHPAVTAFAGNVPAGCDHTGKTVGRLNGWPNWNGWANGKDPAKMLETSRYFDAMNFATRAKCPALVGVGLVDAVCPPEGIFATYNQLKGPKQIMIMPRSGHGAEGPGHAAYYKVYNPFLLANRK